MAVCLNLNLSPGGSVIAGLAIYDTMQHIKSEVSLGYSRLLVDPMTHLLSIIGSSALFSWSITQGDNYKSWSCSFHGFLLTGSWAGGMWNLTLTLTLLPFLVEITA